MLNIKITKENLIQIESLTKSKYIDGFLVYEKNETSIEKFFYNLNELQFKDYKTFKSFYFALINKKKYTTYGIAKNKQKNSCGIYV